MPVLIDYQLRPEVDYGYILKLAAQVAEANPSPKFSWVFETRHLAFPIARITQDLTADEMKSLQNKLLLGFRFVPRLWLTINRLGTHFLGGGLDRAVYLRPSEFKDLARFQEAVVAAVVGAGYEIDDNRNHKPNVIIAHGGQVTYHIRPFQVQGSGDLIVKREQFPWIKRGHRK